MGSVAGASTTPTAEPATPTTAKLPGRGVVEHAALRWERVSPLGVPPVPRAFHSALAVGNTLLILGGESGSTITNNDLSLDIRYLADLHALHLPPADAQPTKSNAAVAVAKEEVADGGAEAVQGVWRQLLAGTGLPSSSLAAMVVVDTTLVTFGGFNHLPDADMSLLHACCLAGESPSEGHAQHEVRSSN